METLLSILLSVNLLISDKTGQSNTDTKMANGLLGLNQKIAKSQIVHIERSII